jgi:hypothetical protein
MKRMLIFYTILTYWDVKDKRLLRWDFVINHTSENPKVIEFDGIQHFKAIGFWGGADGLLETQRRDKIKDDYCKINDIPILRISYLDIDNVSELVNNFLVK